MNAPLTDTVRQALVRLPMLQGVRDAALGLNTAGFVSGYCGSPLGTYDQSLWAAKQHLAAQHIVSQPGVNEELAGTSPHGGEIAIKWACACTR
jgi:indolepyruvate ferredoxin oxidoreductase